MTVIACIATAVLSLVLLLSAKIDALRSTPRSRALSFAGGVAVTYIFLKLLPELTRAQQSMMEQQPTAAWLRSHLLFLVALAGVAIIFGIERAAKRTKAERAEQGEEKRSASWVFALHTLLMAVYVAFIAYLMFHQESTGGVAVLGVVMTLHFSGIAVALADDYRSLYTTTGRWVLAVAVIAGGAIGYYGKLPDMTHDLVLSTLAGAVIFSAIKEEIPPEKQSRFWAFGIGVIAATALLWSAG